jgi:FkbM family methyltransferase
MKKTVLFVLLMLTVFLVFYVTCRKEINEAYTEEEASLILREIHKKLELKHGSFNDEFPEQVMAAMFIKKNDVVLEIGANIGRNTLVISELLENDQNLIALESSPEIADQLNENRIINRKNFKIIPYALSKTPLIQKHWDTMPFSGNDLPEGYSRVPITDLNSIKQSVNKDFTVLVADCEGALYYILKEFPEILDTLQVVIMENDYHDLSHKQEVDRKLKSSGFSRVYHKSGGWGPCEPFFFEVWKRN